MLINFIEFFLVFRCDGEFCTDDVSPADAQNLCNDQKSLPPEDNKWDSSEQTKFRAHQFIADHSEND